MSTGIYYFLQIVSLNNFTLPYLPIEIRKLIVEFTKTYLNCIVCNKILFKLSIKPYLYCDYSIQGYSIINGYGICSKC